LGAVEAGLGAKEGLGAEAGLDAFAAAEVRMDGGLMLVVHVVR